MGPPAPTFCDNRIKSFMTTKEPHNLSEDYRNGCIMMLCFNLLTLVWIAYFMVGFLRSKPTLFILMLVFLISLAILMGTVEYVLLIMALKVGNPYPRVFRFVFDECLVRFTNMTDVQEFL